MNAHRLSLLTVSILAVVTIGGCASGASKAPSDTVLPSRSLTAGAVDVVITPTRLDGTGATFAVSLDTHSADLSLDLTTAAELDVNGTTWPVDSWTGAAPGGHHRAGDLTFTAQGPPTGTVHLTITGLPGPIDATWQVGG